MSPFPPSLEAPPGSLTGDDLGRLLEGHRRELTGYCYRMLGAGSEAEDAVQETMVKALSSIGRFEGRSTLRTWLYTIANNVCVDMLRSPQRRARPMEMGPSTPTAEVVLGDQLPEHAFVQPIADERVVDVEGDPADVAAARESIRLAFVAALQHLPARQRSVLILREVLAWQATEVAKLLDTTVASVNSALQRARATIDGALPARSPTPSAPTQRDLLRRYVDAWERADVDGLVALLREDAVLRMPPEPSVYGRVAIGRFFRDVCGEGGMTRIRALPARANGRPVVVLHQRDAAGDLEPHAILVLEVDGDAIAGFDAYRDPALFAFFG
jgi:RNA polymerase sigma-70 factor (ECF subfamily)